MCFLVPCAIDRVKSSSMRSEISYQRETWDTVLFRGDDSLRVTGADARSRIIARGDHVGLVKGVLIELTRRQELQMRRLV